VDRRINGKLLVNKVIRLNIRLIFRWWKRRLRKPVFTM
jgi:hypothetical protein